MHKLIHKLALTFLSATGLSVAHAQINVSDAWVAATVSAQKASAAYMKIKSEQTLTLIAASSPAAGVVEVHGMNMMGGVMQMRPVENLKLPAGQVVELQRSGAHLMLMDLKQQLKPGQSIPVTLTFETAAANAPRKKLVQQVMLPVRSLTDPITQPPLHQH